MDSKRKIIFDSIYLSIEPKTSQKLEKKIEKSRQRTEDLVREETEEKLMKKSLIFEPQSINLFRIYNHFFEPIDYLFIVLAIIGSIGAGLATPLLFLISSDVFNSIGNTGENKNIRAPPHILKMIQEQRIESINFTMNRNIKRQIIYGIISFVSNFLNLTFWSLIGNRCSLKLKKNYFYLLLSQEQNWFDSYNTYELATKVQAQLDQIERGIGIRIGITLYGISQCITGFAVSFTSSWKTTLVMISVSPIALIFYIILSKILRKGIIIGRKTWENGGGIAEEILYNIKTVASFANFDYELERFYEKVEKVWKIDLMNTFKLGIINGIIIFTLYLDLFLCVIYGRTIIKIDYNGFKGRDFSGPDVFASGLCTLIGFTSINIIGPNIKVIQESCSAASDYFNLYKRKPQMDYSQSIEKPEISQFQGKIEFRGVNFFYPSDPNKKLILENLNLTFEPGKKIALIGESGCGKSTTVNLIERLYDITGGQLLIDGIEINKYDIEYLRNNIGYVQQEPVLFNKTIRDNIIFGREEYLSSIGNIDELIQNACDESYSSEFINNLVEGLDYIVGLKGSKLSGGQKQRIAIARAIISKPKILILDEATSSLDNKSEKEVQSALDSISLKNITTIIIAHRLSTIKNADLIYIMKNGKIIEQGNHEELMNGNGYYASLIQSQLAKEEINNINQIQNPKIIKNISESKRKNDEEIQFERKDNAIALSEHDIPLRPCAIIKELHEYKLQILLACLGSFISGVTTPFIGLFMAKTIISLNSRYETIRFDDGLKYAFIFLAFAFLLGLGNFLTIWKFMSLGLTLARIYRKKLMEKYLSSHLSYFDITKNSPGALLTRMSINTMELNHMLNSILGVTIKCSCIFITALIIGCLNEYRLILINFAFMPIIVISNTIRRQSIETSGKKSIMAKIETGGILSECVMNSKIIFCFNFQKKAFKIFNEILEYTRRQFIRDSIIMGFFMGLGSFCYFVSNIAIYIASKKYMLNNTMESENLSIIMNIANTSSQFIINSLGDLGNTRKAIVAFKLIYSTLETKSLIPPFQKDNQGKKPALNISGKIEFKNVYFAYPTRPENLILKDVSLTILPGKKSAIVGPSGSGKSTIIQLLNRFYDVEEGKGEILIDDINIKNYNLYELRKKIGYVSQDPSLFKISPLENIRYGNLDASYEECLEAAKKANIMALFPEKSMNNNMDEEKLNLNKKKFGLKDGNKKDLLSGGEKQKLCIARTFLKNPTILLLDEPTSSLDKNSELEIQKSLEQLSENRTCVSVSHRLNFIENYDKIYVMESGRIIEEGTHQELLNLKKMYYTLYKFS